MCQPGSKPVPTPRKQGQRSSYHDLQWKYALLRWIELIHQHSYVQNYQVEDDEKIEGRDAKQANKPEMVLELENDQPFIFFFFFFIYFYQLEANHFTILQWFLSYIDMNQPFIFFSVYLQYTFCRQEWWWRNLGKAEVLWKMYIEHSVTAFLSSPLPDDSHQGITFLFSVLVRSWLVCLYCMIWY